MKNEIKNTIKFLPLIVLGLISKLIDEKPAIYFTFLVIGFLACSCMK